MNGMKLWINTLVEYDAVGNAVVLKSFVSPAKDSPVKTRQKTKMASIKGAQVAKPTQIESNEEEIW